MLRACFPTVGAASGTAVPSEGNRKRTSRSPRIEAAERLNLAMPQVIVLATGILSAV
jgi:hypothetical protein